MIVQNYSSTHYIQKTYRAKYEQVQMTFLFQERSTQTDKTLKTRKYFLNVVEITDINQR